MKARYLPSLPSVFLINNFMPMALKQKNKRHDEQISNGLLNFYCTWFRLVNKNLTK